MIDINQLNKEEKETLVRERYQQLESSLNERSRRLFAATEAQALGYGGTTMVHRAIGISRETITQGLRELRENEIQKKDTQEIGRIRKKGRMKKQRPSW